MTLQEDSHTDGKLVAAKLPESRRLFVLGAAVLGLSLMAFYSFSEGAHVDHDPLLTGADWAGYALCHRLTDRSFSISGRQFPLCARCTGMYLGAALAVATLFLAGRWRWALLPRKKFFLVLTALIAVMAVDGLNSYSHFFPNGPHLYEPRNWLRLVTGMGTGLTLGIIVLGALAQSLWRAPVYRPLIGSWRELTGLLLLGAAAVLLVLSNQSALLYVLALASSAGLFFVVTALNTAVLLILLRSDGQAETTLQALRPLLAGTLLATLELAAIGAVRWSLTGTMVGFPGI